MLTVDFDQFPVGKGDRVLDMGCGGGRHAFALYRRGADVVALDLSHQDLVEVDTMFRAMEVEGEVTEGGSASAVRGSAYELPFEDSSFDRIIAAEIMEHLPEDSRAMAELFRVARPGALIAVTVPRWGPEKVNWALSDDYHNVEGGHIRIYKGSELRAKLEDVGLEFLGSHHAHGLHAPYWWLKCAVGVRNDANPLVKAYHQLLVWDMVKQPLATRLAERVLQPVVGKSLVVYLRKPLETARAAA
ncbi:MAG: Methyltransferase type 11 [Frankiales bacterium]|nr:Methyltransferase type 11 [Frankiales bacterium]